jgi:CRISPR/Cas system-associated protein Csm6
VFSFDEKVTIFLKRLIFYVHVVLRDSVVLPSAIKYTLQSILKLRVSTTPGYAGKGTRIPHFVGHSKIISRSELALCTSGNAGEQSNTTKSK